MSDTPQTYTCMKCQAEHTLAEMVKEEPVREGVTEVFLLCPTCGQKVHSHFVTAELQACQQTVDAAKAKFQQEKTQHAWEAFKTAQAVFQRQFDHVNKRWRRKLGILRPAHVLSAANGAAEGGE